MSPLDDVPTHWRDAMEAAGTYSLSQLADKAGIGTSTVSDLVHGRKQSSEHTVQAVSDILRLPATTVREWAAAQRGEREPFTLPPEANRLGRRQRAAVLAVVRAMLDPGEEPTRDPEPDFSKVQGVRLAETEPLRAVADPDRRS